MPSDRYTGILDQVVDDHTNYYSRRGLGLLALGIAPTAPLANTDADVHLSRWYQDDIRSDGLDKFSDIAKTLGDGRYIIPTVVGAYLLGEWTDDCADCSVLGDWGGRTMRASIVGSPMFLALQSTTGGSRPNEHIGSVWRPFQDNNGASGHAFIGALPLITAAQMSEDPYVKTGWYLASALPAWSRVNDDAHFTSQALLGWWAAYVACCAVNKTEAAQRNYSFAPIPMADGIGVGFTLVR